MMLLGNLLALALVVAAPLSYAAYLFLVSSKFLRKLKLRQAHARFMQKPADAQAWRDLEDTLYDGVE